MDCTAVKILYNDSYRCTLMILIVCTMINVLLLQEVRVVAAYNLQSST